MDMKEATGRAYVRRVALWMVVYIALVFALSTSRNEHLLSPPWNWAVAWTPSIPIAGVMWAVLRYMKDSDEFVRALTGKQLVITLFLLQIVCSAWGFMEVYAAAPHVPLYMVVVLFWTIFPVVKAVVRSSS